MDLSTEYLGLCLPHPFVAGASSVGDEVDRVRRFADAGIAAVVLRSLFEEQIHHEADAHHAAAFGHADAHGEASSYLPEVDGCAFGPDEYLAHLAAVKRAVAIPVVASLNGCTEAGWVDYARRLADAGADAIELNLWHVATDPRVSGAEVEDLAVATVQSVVGAVRIPVAVKLTASHASLPHFAARLVAAGARGLVLFNRAYEPDLDVEALEVKTHMEWSSQAELRSRLRWLAILSGQVPTGYAASGGVHRPLDAVKAVMCGAHVLQLVAAVLRGGPSAVGQMVAGLRDWLLTHGYTSLAQLRGSMDWHRAPDPRAFERGSYMRLLQTHRMT
ncbi:MAG: dihydroorotate dehydrogenase-like protein [Planctomycetes bacterium]|nr:dihydroorotate dehydrogenase-like protein [Planctomycetota bacterium]